MCARNRSMIAVVATLERRGSPATTVRIASSDTAGSAPFPRKKDVGQGREPESVRHLSEVERPELLWVIESGSGNSTEDARYLSA